MRVELKGVLKLKFTHFMIINYGPAFIPNYTHRKIFVYFPRRIGF